MKILTSAQENSINCAIREIRNNFNVSNLEKLEKDVFVFETDDMFENFKPISVRYLLLISDEKQLNEENQILDSHFPGNDSPNQCFNHLSEFGNSIIKDLFKVLQKMIFLFCI